LLSIDPENSAEEYRNRVTQPLEGISSKAEIKKMQDLSGACTTEIASFDEFSRFVSGETEGEKFDIIIFDTAPTGHTYDYLNCLLLGQVLQMKILMVLPAWVQLLH
jgi:arsenite-transporting ATPase